MDGHQLDRRDAQGFQVGNLLNDAEVRARMLHPAGSGVGEAADVHFIDDGFREISPQVTVALPIELVVNDDALGRADDAADGRQEVAGQGLAVGIDQPRLRIESVTARGSCGPSA